MDSKFIIEKHYRQVAKELYIKKIMNKPWLGRLFFSYHTLCIFFYSQENVGV